MTQDCKRHRPVIVGHRVHKATRGNGVALPKFVIYEIGRCKACGLDAYRERGTVRAHDAREAAQFAGLPPQDWPTAEPSSQSKAVTAPLTSWPFPVSAHTEQPEKKRKTAITT